MTTETTNNQQPQPAGDVAAELAAATVGCRLSFSWLGQSRKVESDEQAAAAQVFGASAEALRLSKQLFDTSRAEFKAVSKVRSAAKRHWKLATLPFTEPGVRLLRRCDVDAFADKMRGFQSELAAAVAELETVFGELKAEAAERLGSLFNAADYPETLADAFALTFEFPNLSPPDYLARLSPAVYDRERRRLAAQFEQAAELAERAFMTELGELVERITETLTTGENGKPRIFRDSLVENFNAYFDRFRRLSIGSSAELVALVEQAQSALGDATPSALRSDETLRATIRANFAKVSDALTAETNKPARRIVFNRAASSAEPAANAGPSPEPLAAVSEPENEPADYRPAAADVAELAAVDQIGATLAERVAEPSPEPLAEPQPVATSPELASNEPETVEPAAESQPTPSPETASNEPETAEPAANPEPLAAEPSPIEPARTDAAANAEPVVLKFGNGRALTFGVAG